MICCFCVFKGSDVGGLIDLSEALETLFRELGPGRYHIEEISADPLPSGHTSRRWGVGIKQSDGSVMLLPAPPERKSRNKRR